jgi:biotin-(acetyl-CoA carboxylase) ligase
MLIREFMAGSFENFRMEWQRHNALHDRQVEVKTLRGVAQGIVRGVNHDGSLVLQTDAGEVSVTQGEVHVLA